MPLHPQEMKCLSFHRDEKAKIPAHLLHLYSVIVFFPGFSSAAL